jgi:hypothetical protein
MLPTVIIRESLRDSRRLGADSGREMVCIIEGPLLKGGCIGLFIKAFVMDRDKAIEGVQRSPRGHRIVGSI